jgi:signal peptidase II
VSHLKKTLKNYAILIPIACTLIYLDQWTKTLVRSNLAFGEAWTPWESLMPFIRVVHWYNTGVAFGLFQNLGLLFTILPLIISVIIFIYYPVLAGKDWLMRIALSMQFGGAVGNLIDRLTIGHVTDFISIGNFPVFNVADSCITVGVILMVFGMWLQERKENPKKDQDEEILKPDN